jgi:hypothetical protein
VSRAVPLAAPPLSHALSPTKLATVAVSCGVAGLCAAWAQLNSDFSPRDDAADP